MGRYALLEWKVFFKVLDQHWWCWVSFICTKVENVSAAGKKVDLWEFYNHRREFPFQIDQTTKRSKYPMWSGTWMNIRTNCVGWQSWLSFQWILVLYPRCLSSSENRKHVSPLTSGYKEYTWKGNIYFLRHQSEARTQIDVLNTMTYKSTVWEYQGNIIAGRLGVMGASRRCVCTTRVFSSTQI